LAVFACGRAAKAAWSEFVMANQVEPNKWYFAVDCSKCGEAIPSAEAPSPEEESEA
jgi:formylmethanofuran dehydrogenase subunit E